MFGRFDDADDERGGGIGSAMANMFRRPIMPSFKMPLFNKLPSVAPSSIAARSLPAIPKKIPPPRPPPPKMDMTPKIDVDETPVKLPGPPSMVSQADSRKIPAPTAFGKPTGKVPGPPSVASEANSSTPLAPKSTTSSRSAQSESGDTYSGSGKRSYVDDAEIDSLYESIKSGGSGSKKSKSDISGSSTPSSVPSSASATSSKANSSTGGVKSTLGSIAESAMSMLPMGAMMAGGFANGGGSQTTNVNVGGGGGGDGGRVVQSGNDVNGSNNTDNNEEAAEDEEGSGVMNKAKNDKGGFFFLPFLAAMAPTLIATAVGTGVSVGAQAGMEEKAKKDRAKAEKEAEKANAEAKKAANKAAAVPGENQATFSSNQAVTAGVQGSADSASAAKGGTIMTRPDIFRRSRKGRYVN